MIRMNNNTNKDRNDTERDIDRDTNLRIEDANRRVGACFFRALRKYLNGFE